MEKIDGFQLCLHLKELNTIVNTEISKNLKEKGLTQSQITAIKFVAHNKDLTITGLSDLMSIKKSTCSGIVDRLEAVDILKRVKSIEDKRTTHIILSEKGKALAHGVMGNMNGIFSDIFKDVRIETLKIALDSLDEIVNTIKNS